MTGTGLLQGLGVYLGSVALDPAGAVLYVLAAAGYTQPAVVASASIVRPARCCPPRCSPSGQRNRTFLQSVPVQMPVPAAWGFASP